MLSAEIVLATFVFVLAVAIINHAYTQTIEGALSTTADYGDVRTHAGLLLDAQGTQPDWDYASHDSRPLTLASNGSIDISKAAALVALLTDDENTTLSALSAGPYKIGIRIAGQDGSPVVADCPGCSCGGRCSVTLEHYPAIASNNIFTIEGPYRLVYSNGTGVGIGQVKLLFYRTYD